MFERSDDISFKRRGERMKYAGHEEEDKNLRSTCSEGSEEKREGEKEREGEREGEKGKESLKSRTVKKNASVKAFWIEGAHAR